MRRRWPCVLDPATFSGILVSDDAAVYAQFTRSQKCWAHLLRKAIKLTLVAPGDPDYRDFTDRLLDIYREACRVQRDGRLATPLVGRLANERRPSSWNASWSALLRYRHPTGALRHRSTCTVGTGVGPRGLARREPLPSQRRACRSSSDIPQPSASRRLVPSSPLLHSSTSTSTSTKALPSRSSPNAAIGRQAFLTAP
ncbi:MAG: transposase [Planctomycetes bacterium]|nr:transposase [Planctomycetota bacterium]